ncbi:MAG: DUF6265 family protein [Acidobacteriota bacterium]|nr:DUF6265 family protein [Acidobacteriota bacterium]
MFTAVLVFSFILQNPPSPLEPLAFMAGTWRGAQDGVTTEEHWTLPAGGIMLGLHRDVFGDGKAFFEYLRIEVREDGIYYVASPKGRGATSFSYTSGGKNRAVFENPDHDYPKRITYSLDPEGRLVARIDNGEDNDPKARSWRWSRVKL